LKPEGTTTVTELADLIEQGWAVAQRDAPEPTVTYFRDLLTQHPDVRETLFAYACALDFAGHETQAAPAYEQAFAAGLDADDLRRGLLQYGSTLRNLERHDEAVAALQQADRQFPGHDSVKVFLALTLTSAGRCHEAVATLITLALERIDSDDLQRYQWALRNYAADLTT
jgi:tetratricopeptide (TPR) repeat protein